MPGRATEALAQMLLAVSPRAASFYDGNGPSKSRTTNQPRPKAGIWPESHREHEGKCEYESPSSAVLCLAIVVPQIALAELPFSTRLSGRLRGSWISALR